MKNDVQNTIAPLLGDIVEDARDLLRQEFALAKSEIRQEIQKTKLVITALPDAKRLLLKCSGKVARSERTLT